MSFRAGGKIRGTHTTCIELAARVFDIVTELPLVTGISPGYIQSGAGVAGGIQKVKIGEFRGGILLTVRQSRSVQELRVFASDVPGAKLAIAKALRNNKISICFQRL